MDKQTKNLVILLGGIASIVALYRYMDPWRPVLEDVENLIDELPSGGTAGLGVMGPIADRWHSATDGPDIFPPYPEQLGL